jgi:hypothetical protein
MVIVTVFNGGCLTGNSVDTGPKVLWFKYFGLSKAGITLSQNIPE